jgi:hypothetical protein
MEQNHTSRRDVLKLGALGALSAAVASIGTTAATSVDASASPAASPDIPAAGPSGDAGDRLLPGTFTPVVGSSFTAGGHSQVLILSAVDEHPAALPGKGPCFSLLFAGDPSHPIPGGIYPLSNEAVGTFRLFVEPVDPSGAQQHYEAVINRF